MRTDNLCRCDIKPPPGVAGISHPQRGQWGKKEKDSGRAENVKPNTRENGQRAKSMNRTHGQ